MIRLITPPGMLLTVALLAIYTTYGWLVGTVERSWPLLAGAVVSAVACVGIALLRPWARYLVYLLTIGFLAKLADSIYWGVRSGYYGLQFRSPQETVLSLLPSSALAILSLICCWLVHRYFKAQGTAR